MVLYYDKPIERCPNGFSEWQYVGGAQRPEEDDLLDRGDLINALRENGAAYFFGKEDPLQIADERAPAHWDDISGSIHNEEGVLYCVASNVTGSDGTEPVPTYFSVVEVDV